MGDGRGVPRGAGGYCSWVDRGGLEGGGVARNFPSSLRLVSFFLLVFQGFFFFSFSFSFFAVAPPTPLRVAISTPLANAASG